MGNPTEMSSHLGSLFPIEELGGASSLMGSELGRRGAPLGVGKYSELTCPPPSKLDYPRYSFSEHIYANERKQKPMG